MSSDGTEDVSTVLYGQHHSAI